MVANTARRLPFFDQLVDARRDGFLDIATTTFAPSRPNSLAVARPMPLLAPVMIATLPLSRPSPAVTSHVRLTVFPPW